MKQSFRYVKVFLLVVIVVVASMAFRSAAHPHAAFGGKDTQCDVCHKRCCSPCLQNGDYKLCVQTRFANCSICNHASNKHSAVDHK